MTTDISGPRCARTVLSKSGLSLSRIGLGFAHAHLLEADTRVALIGRALDVGITHFDTAALYSDGLSEKVLGRTLAGNRSSVTITSKFGLLPTPIIASMGRAAGPARKARSLSNKLGLMPYPRRSYTPATMRKSLQRSLDALKTDYVDVYQIHEPLPDTLISDDLIAELQRAKTAGLVRAIGVSGPAPGVEEVVSRYGDVLDVIQTSESSWGGHEWVPDITHSLFSDAPRTTPGGSLSSDVIRVRLVEALARRATGSVILQTSSPTRLSQLVEFASE